MIHAAPRHGMSVPELVREELADEEVLSRVSLGGEDELVVTPSRTLIYRAEGLLSGESVSEYPHDADRVAVSDGRRKSTVRLDHGIEGESEFTIPKSSLDDALGPVLGGVLRSAGVVGPEESVRRVYRLGELTLVITDARVIKHIGDALWDEDHEEFPFETVTRLDVEEGEVSSQIIVETDHRPERIKTPSGDAAEVRERVERALLAYHGVGSYEEFLDTVVPEEEASADPADAAGESAGSDGVGEVETDDGGAGGGDGGLSFGGASPLDSDADGGGGRSGDPPADIAEEVATLREAVERQNELLASQQETIERLIEELRRGR